MMASGAGRKPHENGPVAPNASLPDLASKPNWELRDFFDLNYAARKAQAKKAAKAASETGEARVATQSLQARVMADPKLVAHFMAIKACLDPQEASAILALGERLTTEEQESLLENVRALSAPQAAAVLRGLLSELNKATANGPAA